MVVDRRVRVIVAYRVPEGPRVTPGVLYPGWPRELVDVASEDPGPHVDVLARVIDERMAADAHLL